MKKQKQKISNLDKSQKFLNRANRIKVFSSVFISLLIMFSYGGIINATTPNVSGAAWSDNIGWISFNNATCGSAINYGVTIEPAVNNISNVAGVAWSGGTVTQPGGIGWIDFNPTIGFPALPNHSVQLNLVNGQFSGWARACAVFVTDCSGVLDANRGGWDGWINMNGVWLDDTATVNKLKGQAWGGDLQDVREAIIGWISFDGLHREVTTTFEINRPPTATNLNTILDDGCRGLFYKFSWNFIDSDLPNDYQHYYQVQVDNNSNFSSPEINSGKVLGFPGAYSEIYTPLTELDFHTHYHWRVKVWDSAGLNSGWINGSPFDTPLHSYPEPSFTWFPIKPAIDKTVYFTDTSTCFGPGGGTTTCSSWSWDFNSTLPNPTTTFAVAGMHDVTLTVTCHTGFSCSGIKRIDIAAGPPEWIEAPPMIWRDKIKELWSNIVNTVYINFFDLTSIHGLVK